AMSGAALAAGLAGLCLGLALGEGGGLTLGLPACLVQFGARLVEFAPQALVVLSEPLVLLAQAPQLVAQGVEVRQDGNGHGRRVADLDGCRHHHNCLTVTGPASPTTLQAPARSGKGALIKYTTNS